MRKICVLTGTRAEYGLLRPVMNAISKRHGLELLVIAAGIHLSREFGYSAREITKDGFEIAAKVKMNPKKDTGASMAESVGTGITGIACALKKIRPDFLVVLGDRTEALAGTIAAAYMNIPVAHIHGGDLTAAGIDESVRHAITKLANLHFPATKKSAERIRKMGEQPWRIRTVGAPALDTAMKEKLLPRKEVERKFGLGNGEKFMIVVQHPVTTQSKKAGAQMGKTLDAVRAIGIKAIVLYPNSDAGGRKIIAKIRKFSKYPFIRVRKNLPQREYFSLMKFASAIVGNSSSGIIESASFGIPAINIGIRQEGRERSSNVIDVPHERRRIIIAIKNALSGKKLPGKAGKPRIIYGDGNAGNRIAETLAKTRIGHELIQKRFQDG